jgi:hypothetical protein
LPSWSNSVIQAPYPRAQEVRILRMFGGARVHTSGPTSVHPGATRVRTRDRGDRPQPRSSR